MGNTINLCDKKDEELFQLYADLLEEFRQRKLTRTNNNPVADYAEKLITQKFGFIQANKEAKGYDAKDQQGCKYQIKGRRVTRYNNSRQLGVIRNLDEQLFDFLIAAIFNESFAVQEIWKIPFTTVKKYAKENKHQNGHILQLRGEILSDPTVEKIQ
jgi:hypothetical protein